MTVAAGAKAAEPMQWHTGLTEINEGWAEHDGDNLDWARPEFDDSSWQTVDIEDLDAAKSGWRWFRLHVNVGPDHPDDLLMLNAGIGVYELYVNGQRIPGATIQSQFAVARPAERVFELSNSKGDFEIALRTFVPRSYAWYGFPLVIGATLGGRAATRYEHGALKSERMYFAIPAVAINLLLILAGLGVLGLYVSQSAEREYLFLAIFLLLTGVSNGAWHVQQAGSLPMSASFLFADPLVYVIVIAQIEFTLSFVRRRAGLGWRFYEFALLLPPLLIPFVWTGHFSQTTYNLIEATATAPAVFLLPALLFLWYRRGNREAGWIILPSLLSASAGVLYDLGLCSLYLGWNQFEFLIEPVPVGPVPVQTSDAANLLFLLAIGLVIFFRFTRVSREQARSAGELEAARQVQRRLVPERIPHVAGYTIDAAYLPAQEVGGDFYQVFAQSGGETLIVVGDVSGKGLKAAMTGTLIIGALRALSAQGLKPAELLARLNHEMVETQDGGFTTCLCIQLGQDGHVLVANAGHLAPYRDGREIELDSGLPLGIVPGGGYSAVSLQLKPGEMLTLLSDGIVEARNASGELFGFERTQQISRGSAETIAQTAQAFGQEDDITVLTLKFSVAQAA